MYLNNNKIFKFHLQNLIILPFIKDEKFKYIPRFDFLRDSRIMY